MKVKLRELGEIVTGNTPSKQVTEFWDSDDICFVKPDTISDTGISTILSSAEHLAEAARSKARVVGNDAVLVTCIGSIGKIGITGQGEFAFNQQINAIIPNRRVNPKYLAYALVFAKPQLIAIANAPVVPIINKSQFGDFEINIIEGLQKQAEVARTLDIVAGVISKRQQQLSTLDNLIKARFVEMFGTYPSNEKGWPIGTIRDLVTEVRYGSSRKAAEGDSGKYPYLRMNNITYSGELDLSDTKTIDIPADELDKCTVRRGDLLFNRTNSKELVGKTCVYNRDEQMVLAGFVVRVRLNEKALPEFVSAFMNTSFSKQMLLGMCKAAIGQANINAQELQNIGIYIPPIDLQREFVSFKEQIDKSKSAIQKSLDETQILFDSLMQKYFG